MAMVRSHYFAILLILGELGKQYGRVLTGKLGLLLDNADQIRDDRLELLQAFWEQVDEGDDAAADVHVHAPVSEGSAGSTSVGSV